MKVNIKRLRRIEEAVHEEEGLTPEYAAALRAKLGI